jgi:hypothetical protein
VARRCGDRAAPARRRRQHAPREPAVVSRDAGTADLAVVELDRDSEAPALLHAIWEARGDPGRDRSRPCRGAAGDARRAALASWCSATASRASAPSTGSPTNRARLRHAADIARDEPVRLTVLTGAWRSAGPARRCPTARPTAQAASSWSMARAPPARWPSAR